MKQVRMLRKSIKYKGKPFKLNSLLLMIKNIGYKRTYYLKIKLGFTFFILVKFNSYLRCFNTIAPFTTVLLFPQFA
ncbi:hypothetical protein SAMN05444372_1133 [Flavobacterium micromati]|uniref:Uncharacterized protein n=1 Tax=Flavobacterium micromati TaxID=229205 RepID=A0A1M5PLJ1_9FLAO|nr:hypothetical protein SAMN05444372_1133 [Flavobacterium micromati]